MVASRGGAESTLQDENGNAAVLPVATRAGYTFSGWKDVAGYALTKDTIGQNKTFYAQWTANTYTLTFNANGGSVAETSRQVTCDNAYGALPTPARSGYTFQGWFTAASGGTQVSASTKMGAGNTTIYAHWTPMQYALTFNANGGSVSESVRYISYNSAYGTLPVPTRTNATFLGWFTAASGGTQVSASTIMGTSNVTVYAHWRVSTTITTTTGAYTGTIAVPAGATTMTVTMSNCSYACTDGAGHNGQVCYIYICSSSTSGADLGKYYNPWYGGTATANVTGRSTVYLDTNWTEWTYHYHCTNEPHYVTITFE